MKQLCVRVCLTDKADICRLSGGRKKSIEGSKPVTGKAVEVFPMRYIGSWELGVKALALRRGFVSPVCLLVLKILHGSRKIGLKKGKVFIAARSCIWGDSI